MTKKTTEELLYSDETLDTSTFKCPNCGGESEFSANDQKMKCLYCGSLFDIDNFETIEERSLDELLQKGQVWENAEVYQCKSCGAKEIIEDQEISMLCPFCGTNNIIKTDELPGLKPQGVAPFKINKAESAKIAVNWARKKIFAPNSFKKSAKAQNIHGVYNPIFTFDAKTKNQYYGRLGRNVVSYKFVNGRRVAQTSTRYFDIRGEKNVDFDDVLVQASTNIPAEYVKKIEPFPTNKAPKYKPEYLRGYSANTYDKEGKDCWEECKSQMKKRIESIILKSYSYDVKQFLSVKTQFENNKYKFVLVPIYVGNYKYKNKLYNFYVNGDNGKIAGKTPISVWKVLLTVFGILLMIGAISAIFALS